MSQENASTGPSIPVLVSLLARREIEARIVGPLIDALSAEFGRARVLACVREAIKALARGTGAELAQGGCTLAHFADALALWKQDGALEMEVLEQSPEKLSFNVTRCRYAEMYAALGLRDIGAVLSCNRDFSLVEGFNPSIRLTRTQTIMEGAPHCDFRFVAPEPEANR